MRLRSLAAVLLATAPAFAGVPSKGDGTITVLGGLRAIPGGDYAGEAGREHSLWHPGFLAEFGYQLDDELHGGVQIGYMLDNYGGVTPITIHSVQILLALDTVLAQQSWFTLYAGGGIGYSLNTARTGSGSVEANAAAGFVAVGFRFRLVDHLAAVVEERYTIASASADPSSSNTVNMGGNLVSAGLMFHFFSPGDKGHPTAPGE
ncbi:MAG TPA: outer membrane beta-barrel protein [Myxococcales bacterium]|nr:outer membrane beta-barrel protein [Myxococcales bacterium]